MWGFLGSDAASKLEYDKRWGGDNTMGRVVAGGFHAVCDVPVLEWCACAGPCVCVLVIFYCIYDGSLMYIVFILLA